MGRKGRSSLAARALRREPLAPSRAPALSQWQEDPPGPLGPAPGPGGPPKVRTNRLSYCCSPSVPLLSVQSVVGQLMLSAFEPKPPRRQLLAAAARLALAVRRGQHWLLPLHAASHTAAALFPMAVLALYALGRKLFGCQLTKDGHSRARRQVVCATRACVCRESRAQGNQVLY